MRIGVDVGGTNTDAVILAGRDVIGAVKRPTTSDVSSGIAAAIGAVMSEAGIRADQIQAVMIGTTHFTNAFVQRQHLEKVYAIRIGYPASRGIPPFSGWPNDVRRMVEGGAELVPGGYEFDGRAISPFDERAVRQAARAAADKELTQLAISCIFSQLNSDQEQRAAEIAIREVPDLDVSISSELGRAGLLERENAAIMNASLRPLAEKVAGAFRKALEELGLSCPWYVSQNDGTLMDAERLRKYPVLTFAAGPTNSLRGAAWLTNRSNAIVVDIGGTTSDVGVLNKGFPRQSSVHVDVGGVRTNFKMPDIISVGLGGGSRVRASANGVTVGPDSVGFRLLEDAKIFGGDTLTTSDVAVAAGWAHFGDKALLANITPRLISDCQDAISQLLDGAIDRMKTSPEPVPAILVGGGSVLAQRCPAGVSELLRPEHAGVANAIGAAIGQVGGEIDQIYNIGNEAERAAALEDAKDQATQRAIAAGALSGTVEVIDLDAIPLQYLPGGATRVLCRAIGDLGFEGAVA